MLKWFERYIGLRSGILISVIDWNDSANRQAEKLFDLFSDFCVASVWKDVCNKIIKGKINCLIKRNFVFWFRKIGNFIL